MTWDAQNIIDADVLEARSAQRLKGCVRRCDTMHLSQPFEPCIIQGLYAHAHTIDAEGQPLARFPR